MNITLTIQQKYLIYLFLYLIILRFGIFLTYRQINDPANLSQFGIFFPTSAIFWLINIQLSVYGQSDGVMQSYKQHFFIIFSYLGWWSVMSGGRGGPRSDRRSAT